MRKISDIQIMLAATAFALVSCVAVLFLVAAQPAHSDSTRQVLAKGVFREYATGANTIAIEVAPRMPCRIESISIIVDGEPGGEEVLGGAILIDGNIALPVYVGGVDIKGKRYGVILPVSNIYMSKTDTLFLTMDNEDELGYVISVTWSAL